jgi:hypothetical protein
VAISGFVFTLVPRLCGGGRAYDELDTLRFVANGPALCALAAAILVGYVAVAWRAWQRADVLG